jgi:hypothetical protein
MILVQAVENQHRALGTAGVLRRIKLESQDHQSVE